MNAQSLNIMTKSMLTHHLNFKPFMLSRLSKMILFYQIIRSWNSVPRKRRNITCNTFTPKALSTTNPLLSLRRLSWRVNCLLMSLKKNPSFKWFQVKESSSNLSILHLKKGTTTPNFFQFNRVKALLQAPAKLLEPIVIIPTTKILHFTFLWSKTI